MAAKCNLTIDQGTTFTHRFILKNVSNVVIDLSDYSIRSQIRYNYYSTDAIETFTAYVVSPATNGIIEISLSDTETAAIKADRYVYDIELINIDDDTVYRVIQGIITISPEVTKDT